MRCTDCADLRLDPGVPMLPVESGRYTAGKRPLPFAGGDGGISSDMSTGECLMRPLSSAIDGRSFGLYVCGVLASMAGDSLAVEKSDAMDIWELTRMEGRLWESRCCCCG
jgi:hypothetical protein